MDPMDEKWKAFGWNTLAIDGHDIKQVLEAIDEADHVKVSLLQFC